MQDIESLRGLITTLIKDLDRLERAYEKISTVTNLSVKDLAMLEYRVITLEKKVEDKILQIETIVKDVRSQISSRIEEINSEVKLGKKTLISIILGVLTGSIFFGKHLEINKVLANLFGLENK